MTGLGTIVNMAAILIGSAAGLLLKGGLPKRFQDTITGGVGLCTIFIGATGALSGLLSVKGAGFETRDTMLMIGCMVVGAAIGEWMNIEDKLERTGEWCKSKIPAGHASSTFVDAFVTSSLMYCVGAMAIVGALEDGLSHNYTTLFAKSIMDGVLSVVFAAAMGIGVAFSMIPVGIYQGGITLLAGVVKPYLTELMIGRMSCIGSILIFALGLNLTTGSRIKIGNMLPAVFLPIIVCLAGF
ncbi:DUF554 domain-containing protein [Lacrimispora sp. 210928-DFI.3.58]|uniref:DUF554 domain-containing protein n=1 Tax=Lacrimispora sp. 210928-DFI.3.58 TaxID=2883214 RepID=UPI001D074F04|nr:DUF554 domain-containing protein [Lacrimispora sp. 210928-DFI.3.58]MCB7320414.1 DUF554 domain-containing protein [Lacrimispora sp. 210928-DFI.3.58]